MTVRRIVPDQGVGDHDVIARDGEVSAVVVPIDEYRRLKELERLASPEDLERAEMAVQSERYAQWEAAGRPGAVPHDDVRRMLLGDQE